MKTENILLLAGAGVLAYLIFSKPSPPPLTVVRTIPAPGSSSALTASEIAAGASVANNLIDDLFGNDSSS